MTRREKVGNWTQGEKRGRVFGMLKHPGRYWHRRTPLRTNPNRRIRPPPLVPALYYKSSIVRGPDQAIAGALLAGSEAGSEEAEEEEEEEEEAEMIPKRPRTGGHTTGVP
eukprot:2856644-Pyramimonas_sp.AAC.1